MILDRPRAIHLDDCSTQEPLDRNTPTDPSKILPMSMSSATSSNMPTAASAPLVRYALAIKVHEMRSLKLHQPHPKNSSLIENLHDQIVSILDNAPPVLRSTNPDTSWDSRCPYLPQQREELLILVQLFLINLHRPHIASRRESRRAAFEASIVVLESQQRWFGQTNVHHYKLFGLSFYTIDAAILLSIIALLYPAKASGVQQRIDTILQQAMSRLSAMKPYNLMANSGLGILQLCYQKLETAYQTPDFCGSPIELQDLQKELNNQTSISNMNTETVFVSPQTQMETELPAWDISDTMTNFYDTYWLDQINQIYPSSWVDPDSGNMFGSTLLG